MEMSDSMGWMLISTCIVVCLTVGMMVIRAKGSNHPTSVKKIVLPPLFMSTGALMFIFPVFRIDWQQCLEAVCVGMVCSILLIYTTRFEVIDQQIYLIPSKAFLLIASGLLAARIIYKMILGQTIALGELSGAFYMLALAMIVTWRIAMVIQFKRIERSIT